MQRLLMLFVALFVGMRDRDRAAAVERQPANDRRSRFAGRR